MNGRSSSSSRCPLQGGSKRGEEMESGEVFEREEVKKAKVNWDIVKLNMRGGGRGRRR